MNDLEMGTIQVGPKSNHKCPCKKEAVRGICLQRKREARWLLRQDATLLAWKMKKGTRSQGIMECNSRSQKRPGKGTGSLLGLLDGGSQTP